MSMLPSSLGALELIEWIPVDVLALAIIELSLKETPQQQAGKDSRAAVMNVIHALNVKQSSWTDISEVVKDRLAMSGSGARKELAVVSWKEWVAALRVLATSSFDGAEAVSGVKLLDFFDSLTGSDSGDADEVNAYAGVFESKNTLNESPTLANLEPVGSTWMNLWMDQWGY
jgi:hypothetical protein